MIENYKNKFNNKLEQLKKENKYRKFTILKREPNIFPKVYDENGNIITLWCSNDYLGMGMNQEVIDSMCYAIKTVGVGAGGTRNIAGNSLYINDLEEEIKLLHNKEKALVFSSGYVANETSLTALGKILDDCIIFSDKLIHASMIKGISHSKCKKEIFNHNDVEHLEQLLKKYDYNQNKVIAFESIYSMNGSIAPIEKIVQLAKKYNALTYIDEVHAVGMYGDTGAGVAYQLGIDKDIDIIQGTLGKAYGHIGGYIAASKEIIDIVRSFGSGFIFTTALPPAIAFSASNAIRLLRDNNLIRIKHKEIVQKTKKKLIENNIPVLENNSHIIPVMVRDAQKTSLYSKKLLDDHRIFIQGINYPTVAVGTERLRVTPTPFHSEEMIDELVSALKHIMNL